MDNTTAQQQQADERPPPPPQGRRRIYRQNDDRIIGGVASGVAEYFNIDPVIVRGAFVLLTFASGAGIVLYLLGLIVLPEDAPNRSATQGRRPSWSLPAFRGRRWPVLALVFIAAAIALNHFSLRPRYIWPIVIVGSGIYLLGDRHPRLRNQLTGQATPWSAETTPANLSSPITTPAYGGNAVPKVLPPKRTRSRLGVATLGVALVVSGLAVMTDRSGIVHLQAHRLLAMPLVVIAAGLVAGARFGRAKWLAVPALLLVPVIALTYVVEFPHTTATGKRIYRVTSASDLHSSYNLAAGSLTLDLSQLDSVPGDISVSVHVGAGNLEVITPKNDNYGITGSAGIGQVTLPAGHASSGTAVSASAQGRAQVPIGMAGTTSSVHITLRTGLGRVFVTTNPNDPELSNR